MKTIVLALAAAAALGFAAPAFAQDGAPRGVSIEKVQLQTQDFSSRHRYWRHHHRHCWTHWRHGRRVTVCR
jgi:Ni/Co efflux regulator RcnB